MAHTHRPDIYPQWLNLTKTVESATNTYTETETASAVRGNLVMEIMAIELEINTLLSNTLASAHSGAILQVNKKASTDSRTINDNAVLRSWRPGHEQVAMEATETGAAGSSQPLVSYQEYAPGRKGFLMASPTLRLGIKGTLQIAARTATGRILYRLVKVSDSELLGLLSE